jgi:YqiJ-like protein
MDLVSAENAPFLVAICLMVVIGALEGLSLVVGTGLSHHLDHLFGMHFDGPNAGEGVLGWLHIGRAPILVLLVIFLMAFAISGLILQWATAGVLGQPLPAWIASLFAAACALPVVRMLGGLISRAIPRDESTAVSEATFVGRIARITGESASEGRPGQAKLTDEHGQSHYLLVEPDGPGVTFARGDVILVVSRASGTVFRAIRNPRPDLL